MRHGGFSKPNRFNIIFKPPSMSLINLDPTNLIANAISGNFSLRDLVNDPRDISMLCQSATIPGRQITTFETSDRDAASKIPYGYMDMEVNCTFLLTQDYYMKNIFDNWMQIVFNTDDAHPGYKTEIVTDVRIQQLNKRNRPIYGVVLKNAYPVSITDIVLDNSATDSISTFTI
ncbi:uncharacterized protein METZ01_LOCUS386045, partial [marine metagenome]